MGLLLNRAKANTATTGTGAVTPGSGVLPFRSWSAAGAVSGEWYNYLIEDGSAWEIGLGLYNGTTITRPGPGTDPNFDSSTGALVNLTGSATIACVASKTMQGPQLIGRTVLTGTAASISFTGITAAFEDLEIAFMGRGDNASTEVELRARFNADTGSNYDGQKNHAYSTGSSFSQYTAQAYMHLGFLAAANAPASAVGSAAIDVPAYARTSFHKSARAFWTSKNGTGTFSQGNGTYTAQWRNTAAITQIELLPSAGNFAAGTVCSLYGKG